MFRGRGKVIPLRDSNVVEDEAVVDPMAEFEVMQAGSLRPFPLVSTMPRLPLMIPDEILDYYGWVFCQGGFLNLQMTFEQFLAVVAAVSPSALCPECDTGQKAASG
jgi:hypothetical protein